MRKKKLNLYVWANPYQVHYGGSSFIAVAESVEKAKAMAKTAAACSFATPSGAPPQIELGEPTSVHEGVQAMWDHWEE